MAAKRSATQVARRARSSYEKSAGKTYFSTRHVEAYQAASRSVRFPGERVIVFGSVPESRSACGAL